MCRSASLLLFFWLVLGGGLLVAAKECQDDGRGDPTMTCAGDVAQQCIENHRSNDHEHRQTAEEDDQLLQKSFPSNCRVAMAPSTIPNAGFGIFSMVKMARGTPTLPGDVVIQVADLNVTHADGMQFMLQEYLWQAEETGGFYEGQQVISVLPGVGMLANGLPQHNVLPFVPQVDEAGLTRRESPGSGAISYYHNFSFFAQKELHPGDELFVNFGDGWFNERQKKLTINQDDAPTANRRNIEWIPRNGYCLDNLRAARSRLPHAGRGAFVTRPIEAASIVAPVPVLPISKREALDITRERLDGKLVQTKQLLLNYCYGHVNSSLLLYPYGPIVNLINHHGTPNVKLQWSRHTVQEGWLDHPLSKVKSMQQSGLLLELIALRDLKPGEEVWLDYGLDWVEAWRKHATSWQPPPGSTHYAPSYVYDDVVKSLRLEAELKEHPYPDNIFTSCFYRYSDHKDQVAKENAQSTRSGAVTTVQWKQSRGIFEFRNLRPCSILKREHRKKEGTVFMVRIANRYGLAQEERIPKGAIHIVTQVPRRAVRFSDKLYTTDQHLEGSFRHEIGFDGYPKQWLDLA